MTAAEIEKELIKISKFRGKQSDRQDFLAALVRQIQKVDDDAFKGLSDPAYNWYDNAVLAMNKHRDIVEFADDPASDAEGEPAPAEAEEPEEVENEPEEPTPPSPPDGESVDEEVSEVEPSDPAETDPVEPESPEPKKKAKKAKKPKRDTSKGFRVTKLAQPEMYDGLTGEKDKWGLIAGTKVSMAMDIFEKGCTSHQVNEAIGGKFYNALKLLQQKGHRLEKRPGGFWKLTHKDDLKKGS